MLRINLAVFASSGMQASFMSEVSRAISDGSVTMENGRFKSWAALNSLAGRPFHWKGRQSSIAALLAVKNGYTDCRLTLRGSDFVKVGSEIVAEILASEGMSHLLPVSNAKPVTRNNVGNSAEILADLGL